MRTVLNSFPILWSIWNTPSTPLFLLRWPSLCVLTASGTISSSQPSVTSSTPYPLPQRPFYPFMSPDFIRLPLSKPFCPVPFTVPPFSPISPPSLLCLVYTRLLACPLSFQPLKAFQAANKRQVPTTTKGLSAAFE